MEEPFGSGRCGWLSRAIERVGGPAAPRRASPNPAQLRGEPDRRPRRGTETDVMACQAGQGVVQFGAMVDRASLVLLRGAYAIGLVEGPPGGGDGFTGADESRVHLGRQHVGFI